MRIRRKGRIDSLRGRRRVENTGGGGWVGLPSVVWGEKGGQNWGGTKKLEKATKDQIIGEGKSGKVGHSMQSRKKNGKVKR